MNFLPGWSPGFIASGALTSITQVGTSTSTGATINFPAGIQAGDLIVLVDRAIGSFNTLPTDVTPSGFTLIGTVNQAATGSPFVSVRQNLWYKLATGSESGALTGMDGAGSDHKAMYVFRGNKAASVLTVGSVGGQSTDSDPTAQNVTASSGVAPLVVIGAYGSTGTVDPRTFSTTKDGEINPSVNCYLAYKIYNSAPADSSIDMADEGSGNSLQSCYIQMS